METKSIDQLYSESLTSLGTLEMLQIIVIYDVWIISGLFMVTSVDKIFQGNATWSSSVVKKTQYYLNMGGIYADMM